MPQKAAIMNDIINIIAPVFLLIALGYAAMRFELLTREQVNGIGTFVIRLGMPALIFHALTTRSFEDLINPIYLTAYTIASIIGFIIGWLGTLKFSSSRELAALNGMAFGMANTGFIGYPLLSMVIGNEEAAGFFAMNVLVEMVLILPATLILLSLSQKEHAQSLKQTIKHISRDLLRNNMILALLLGSFCTFLHIPIPEFIHRSTGLLMQATTPLALFVIGAGLFGLAFQGKRSNAIWVAAIRMTLFIGLVSGSLMLLNADKLILFIGLLLSTAPIPSTYAILGRQHGQTAQTAAISVYSTILSILPIALVLWWWH